MTAEATLDLGPNNIENRRLARPKRPLIERGGGWLGVLWVTVAIVGQWAFGAYIFAFYGRTVPTGDFQAWSVLGRMGAIAYMPGDTAGNLTFATHALAAGLVAVGGGLQLIPQVRRRFPTFHRWNGRVFLSVVIALSFSGFYLVWGRGHPPTSLGKLGTTLNGLLILGFAVMAWRAAVSRRLIDHRRWALRLYLVSNAQWFTRVGFFAYALGNLAIGRRPSMHDPFFMFWSFGCYLLPLAVLELYTRARDGGGPALRMGAVAVLLPLTLAMAAGVVGFSAFSIRIASGAPLSMLH